MASETPISCILLSLGVPGLGPLTWRRLQELLEDHFLRKLGGGSEDSFSTTDFFSEIIRIETLLRLKKEGGEDFFFREIFPKTRSRYPVNMVSQLFYSFWVNFRLHLPVHSKHILQMFGVEGNLPRRSIFRKHPWRCILKNIIFFKSTTISTSRHFWGWQTPDTHTTAAHHTHTHTHNTHTHTHTVCLCVWCVCLCVMFLCLCG